MLLWHSGIHLGMGLGACNSWVEVVLEVSYCPVLHIPVGLDHTEGLDSGVVADQRVHIAVRIPYLVCTEAEAVVVLSLSVLPYFERCVSAGSEVGQRP